MLTAGDEVEVEVVLDWGDVRALSRESESPAGPAS